MQVSDIWSVLGNLERTISMQGLTGKCRFNKLPVEQASGFDKT